MQYLSGEQWGWPASARVHRLANIVNPAAVQVGAHCRIDAFVTISGPVRIGRYVHIGTGVGLFGDIEVCDFAALSPGAQAYSGTENLRLGLTNPTAPAEHRFAHHAPVKIGRHALVGTNAVLLPGAMLGEGCVLGALSLAREELAAWTRYSGVPLVCRGPRHTDALEREQALEAARGMG